MNYSIRLLELGDYSKGFIELLSFLTEVGDWNENKWKHFFNNFQKIENQATWVIETNNKIIGTISITWEHKFIHGGSIVGHIEDVVIHPDYQKQGIGSKLVQFVIERAKLNKSNCYKLILDCSHSNKLFYQKFGFEVKDNHLALYL